MSGTFFPPPPENHERAPIENLLQIRRLAGLGRDIFTNVRPQPLPSGARGIYGGGVIAQAIMAAQQTVGNGDTKNHELGEAKRGDNGAEESAKNDFYVHSCHCYFVLAGAGNVPILYHVQRTRDGRSFATRLVEARQGDQVIALVTMSFQKLQATTTKARPLVHHETPFPTNVAKPPSSEFLDREWAAYRKRVAPDDEEPGQKDLFDFPSTFFQFPTVVTHTVPQGLASSTDNTSSSSSSPSPYPSNVITAKEQQNIPEHEQRGQRWVRARGRISAEGGHAAHAASLAYISDNLFIGMALRVHSIWFGPKKSLTGMSEAERRPYLRRLLETGTLRQEQAPPQLKLPATHKSSTSESNPQSRAASCSKSSPDRDTANETELKFLDGLPRVGMLVSLDHTIYFHQPLALQSDDWMLFDAESPWAGDERGLVVLRIYNRDGLHLATCFQEGVIRLDVNAASKL